MLFSKISNITLIINIEFLIQRRVVFAILRYLSNHCTFHSLVIRYPVFVYISWQQVIISNCRQSVGCVTTRQCVSQHNEIPQPVHRKSRSTSQTRCPGCVQYLFIVSYSNSVVLENKFGQPHTLVEDLLYQRHVVPQSINVVTFDRLFQIVGF